MFTSAQPQTPQTPQTPQATNDEADMAAWREYKRNPNPTTRSALLNRFTGILRTQVSKWSGGQIASDVLMNEARVLAVGAFDSYNPAMGASLATHVTNQLLPLSRIVYTYSQAARMPENLTRKLHTYNTAVDTFKNSFGREPTTDELHSELGWSAGEITRIRDYNHKDLVESGPTVSGSFFDNSADDEDDMLLGAIYFELAPDEKRLFEHVTGYNGAKVMANPELMKTFGMSQAQLSYKKTQLKNKIDTIMKRQHRTG